MPLATPQLTEFTTPSPVIASYDFDSLASGLNYRYFYFLVTGDASAQYSLQDNANTYSTTKETIRFGIGTTTLTFDSPAFHIPRTIKGTAYLSFGVYHSLGALANTYQAQLWKWDGASATAITSQLTKTVGIGVFETVYSFEMPCTETLIAEGEQLRIIIIMTIPAGGAGTRMVFGHDPKNLDGEWISPSAVDTITSSRINIPFKTE